MTPYEYGRVEGQDQEPETEACTCSGEIEHSDDLCAVCKASMNQWMDEIYAATVLELELIALAARAKHHSATARLNAQERNAA